jgi:hypothetical protein
MKTSLLKIYPAVPDPLVEARMYYQLSNLDLENLPGFLSAYCKYVRFAIYPFPACLVNAEAELWHPSAEWGIVLRCPFRWNKSDELEDNPDEHMDIKDVTISLFHEIIHIFINIIGYPIHDEGKIEHCAQILASRFPDFSDLIEKLYPGFSIKNRVLKRRFYNVVFVEDGLANTSLQSIQVR